MSNVFPKCGMPISVKKRFSCRTTASTKVERCNSKTMRVLRWRWCVPWAVVGRQNRLPLWCGLESRSQPELTGHFGLEIHCPPCVNIPAWSSTMKIPGVHPWTRQTVIFESFKDLKLAIRIHEAFQQQMFFVGTDREALWHARSHPKVGVPRHPLVAARQLPAGCGPRFCARLQCRKSCCFCNSSEVGWKTYCNFDVYVFMVPVSCQ